MSNNSKVSLNKNSFNLNKIKQKIPNLISENKLVVGSQARILYADAVARSLILRAFS